ncbi:MAG TPA: DUF1778 domain-containing protein [Acidimicrobiales bacterium]|nr:DUF1778 domain-containing protein [Acidimicrobiales bacterium]
MAVKTNRLETRVSPEERTRIEHAAAVAGMSVSAFVLAAAMERAEEVITESMTITVPADFFDALLADIDDQEPVPQLAKVARRARRHPRIVIR